MLHSWELTLKPSDEHVQIKEKRRQITIQKVPIYFLLKNHDDSFSILKYVVKYSNTFSGAYLRLILHTVIPAHSP